MQTKLLTFSNAKTTKGEKKGYLTGILYLAPAMTSGVLNVCPKASEGCKKACLFTAGRGAYNNVQEARKRKTLEYYNDRDGFIETLLKDIDIARKVADKKGLTLVLRPNGTSDLPFVGRKVAEANSDIQVYDYTKVSKPWERQLPNYKLTFSRSETNEAECIEALDHGINVAVVFSTKKGQALPETYLGRKVVDGDETDLRFLDETGVIVGLRAKGKAKHDTTGFVVQV
jgi:hypothetical protein